MPASRSCGLETLDGQLGLLDGLPARAAERKILLQALEEAGEIEAADRADARRLAPRRRGRPRAQPRGRLRGLSRARRRADLQPQRTLGGPGVRRCSRTTRTSLVVVGAMHLVGERGLPALLARARLPGRAALTAPRMSHFEEASRYIAGGVNSPVRAFRGVGGEPLFIRRARGASHRDEDGRRLIDYVGSWGPMILGHAHPDVVAAVTRRAADGLSFGAPTVIETELARRVTRAHAVDRDGAHGELGHRGDDERDPRSRAASPAATASSSSRAAITATPTALLVKAGSGALTLGVPDSAGVPAAVAAATTTLPYNDAAALERCFAEAGREIACVIVEPVVGNMGCVPPAPGFLRGAARALHAPRRAAHLRRGDDRLPRRARRRAGALRRHARPHHARQDHRRRHAGRRLRRAARRSWSGSRRSAPSTRPARCPAIPVAMAAGLATLEGDLAPGFHERLALATDAWSTGSRARRARPAIPFAANRVCGMFSALLHGGRPGRPTTGA